ncbi:heavy metal-binding domain-containing protein [Adhaeribacter aquaticus]|uniref:heavy metal-binding domain-containing protein n=1 Tax=Adhaeribacter aquaticus TaxID=299567 RepID=UPI0003F85E49|nr:heavy metal-binding domain-containing protein [Adhaeribacter aquaticus]
MKNILGVLVLLFNLALLPACTGNGAGETTEATATEHEHASDPTMKLAYVCPMKCEGSGSNEPGKCKVCDMDLVKNPDFEPAQDSLKTN